MSKPKRDEHSYDLLAISKGCSSVASTLAIQAIRQSYPPIRESSLLTVGTVFSWLGFSLVVAAILKSLLSRR